MSDKKKKKPAKAVIAEIDSLDKSLAELDPAGRKEVAKRLRELLVKFTATEGKDAGKDLDDVLLDAAVDRVLDFLVDEIF
jgi:hypothetical protein